MCSESRDQEQENLERWRCGLEKRGRVVTRPAVMYGSEKVVLKKRFRTDSVKIFIQSDEDREDYSWLYIYGDRVRKPMIKLRWFGHMQRRDGWYIGKRMLSSLAGGKEEDHREEDAWISWDGPLWQAQREQPENIYSRCMWTHPLVSSIIYVPHDPAGTYWFPP